MELVLLSLSTFVLWAWVRTFLPHIPHFLHLPAVSGIAYGMTLVPPIALLVLAVSGVVALVHVVGSIGYAERPWPRLVPHLPKRDRTPERPSRIPSL